ncbi:hypothetical protein ACM26W_08695 [Halomonas sp. HK25]|uniref:hypothetical protein n=1 Tax=Halomonas sp. HK25 TaxID=3394321 RepID=UPI0039FD9AA1
MTTSIALIVMTAMLAVGGVVLLRAQRQKSPASCPRLVASVLAGLVLLFLLWMVIMVLVVGPHMRTI